MKYLINYFKVIFKEKLLLTILLLFSITCKSYSFGISSFDVSLVSNVPQSEINAIYQDSKGFIWLGTLDGLFRYDGFEFKAYYMDHKPYSISSNMILSIAEDVRGNIWVGTYGRGISMLDPHTGRFTNYSISTLVKSEIANFGGDVKSLIIDSKNRLFIGNHYGIVCAYLNKNNSRIEKKIFIPSTKYDVDNKNFISCIYEDQFGYIWVGKNNYIERNRIANGALIPIQKYSINSTQITGDEYGIYIVGTSVYKIPFISSKGEIGKITKIFEEKADVVVANKKHLWVGNRNGVYCLKYSDANKKWDNILHLNKENLPFKFNSDVISDLVISQNNILWVGTRGGGVYNIIQKNNRFQNYSPFDFNKGIRNRLTRAVFEDSHNNLWIGDEENGVFYLEHGQDFSSSYLQIDVNDKYNNRGYAFEETFCKKPSNGLNSIIWVGTCYPLCIRAINPLTRKFINLPQTSRNVGFVFALKKTDNNTLWAGTYNNGLWRLTLDDMGNIIRMKQFSQENSNISSDIIRSFYIDKNGNLWIGTDIGINRILKNDLQKSKIYFHHKIDDRLKWNLNNYYIQTIEETNDNHILIGTMGDGLLVFDRNTLKIRRITTTDGLNNNTIKMVLQDSSSGNLWLSTNNGLACIRKCDGKVVNYSKGSGLQEAEFCELCGIKRRNGDFLFGNRNGFVAFKPNQITINKKTPEVYITNIFINNREAQVNADSKTGNHILTKTPEYTDLLKLNYEEHNISIEFIGLNYSAPQEIKYAYKLEGFDKDWNYTSSNQRRATYTNLPEGEYVFKVKAANGDRIWQANPVEMRILIAPPYSRTWWAYIIYLLLIIVAIYVTYIILKAFYRRNKEVYSIQMEKEKIEEVTQYRLQFFTDISHEFRTPLTLITIPLESLITRAKEKVDTIAQKDLNVIQQNCLLLKYLIDQLLDFRKIERGKENIKLHPVNMAHFLKLFYICFGALAEKQNIDWNFKVSDESLIADIDERLFEKVMFNLLSNAFKYTPNGKSIEYGLYRDERNKIVIYVKDTGNGISEDELPYIFDRFYRGKERCYLKQDGSGIGLNLCKSIVELHHGEIEVTSKKDEGTLCKVYLNVSMNKCPDNNNYSLVENYNPILNTIQDDDDVINSKDIPTIKLNIDSNIPSVLLVEDNEELLKQLKYRLQDTFRIITAENGEIGINMALDRLPDIIVTDIKMPVMGGLEMCEKIKQNEQISHIPIIVLTANATIQSRIDSFNLGKADAYLEKPFSIDVLKTQINSILRNREVLKEKFRKDAIISPEEIAHTKTDLKFMTEVVAIIKKNISNSDLTIESIAQDYGVSRTYLNRKIKALTNETSNQFLRNIRLKYAAQLILQKKLNISEIAWEVGYNDISTFRIRFKERFGVTPTAYKNASGEDLSIDK